MKAYCRLASLVLGLALLAPAKEATAGIWPSSNTRAREALASEDPVQRRRAAAKLLTLPPKLARELALAALDDDDDVVRLLAAQAAASLAVPGASEKAIPWLQERDATIRIAACNLMEAVPSDNALPGLARALGDGKSAVRKAAAGAMGASGSSEAVSPLLGRLDDASPAVRLEVVRALARLGDKRSVVPLVARLQDQEFEVRRAAARALGRLGDQRATATLLLALQDQQDVVKVEALQALGQLRSADSVNAVAALLSGPDRAQGAVAEAATRCLGRIGNEEATQLLVRMLEREGPRPLGAPRAVVREALVEAGPSAIQALEKSLRASPSSRLATAAVLALGASGHRASYTEIIRAARRGLAEEDASLRALGALGEPKSLTFVLEQLDSEDPAVRRTAAAVVLDLLDPARADGRAVDVVKPRLTDLTTPVGERIALAKVLGATGSPRAEPLLRSLLEHDQEALRIAAMRALKVAERASPETEKLLVDALEDETKAVRLVAAQALAAVGGNAGSKALLEMLSRSGVDRHAVGLALSGALGRSDAPGLAVEAEMRIPTARPAVRDALIEGLGRMKTDEAGAALARLAKSSAADDRRKVAEALVGHPKQAAALVKLASDLDPAVRANAVWSLRETAPPAALPELSKRLADADAAVAGNAGVALGTAAQRHRKADAAVASLCATLADPRAYVRVGALQGLRRLGRSCDGGAVEGLLRRDSAWRVRAAAAHLLHSIPGRGVQAERALYRCQVDDRDATVAATCAKAPVGATERDDVLVFVVPQNGSRPVGRAPFALVHPDGVMRLGAADRRGAVFEAGVPRGEVSLAVPAALAR